MGIINDIYCARLYPAEQRPQSKRYIQAMNELNVFSDKFLSGLSKNQLCELNTLFELNNNVSAIECEYCYEQGFITGLKLGFECNE